MSYLFGIELEDFVLRRRPAPERKMQAFPFSDFPPLTTDAEKVVMSTWFPRGGPSEFRLKGEDFPELPRADMTHRGPDIDSTDDHHYSNIPKKMVQDQFGIVGILAFFRGVNDDPFAQSWHAEAFDNPVVRDEGPFTRYNFPGALLGCTLQPERIDFPVPEEFRMSEEVPPLPQTFNLLTFSDDLLLYLYFTFVGDVVQIAAASALYDHHWRYHVEWEVWLRPGSDNGDGHLLIFNPKDWRQEKRPYCIADLLKFAPKPRLPPPYARRFAPESFQVTTA